MSRRRNIENAKMALSVIEEMQFKLLVCALYLMGISVLFIHHAGKGGQQRGTSRREDVLDTVIAMRKPADFNPGDGAYFEIHFEKARGLYG